MDINNLAPIVLFVYNRPLHADKTIKTLLQNKYAGDSILIIYSDGPKTEADRQQVDSVRKYIRSIKGFASIRIIERDKNFGLGNNIIEGVTAVVNEYGKVIVLEDDLITTPYFLQYMNEGLNKYGSSKSVISIQSYIYPLKKKLPDTFFIKGADCLGWATWKNRWQLFEPDGTKLLHKLEEEGLVTSFDFNNTFPYTQMLKDQIEGKNSSWAIRWYASALINDMLSLYPGRSLIYHAGNDGSGTNFGNSGFLDVKLINATVEVKDIPIKESKYARKRMEYYLKHHNAGFIRIGYRKIKAGLLSLIRHK